MMQPATGSVEGSVNSIFHSSPQSLFLVNSWAAFNGKRTAIPKKAGV